VLVAELSKRVGRSVDTIKRWEEQGLLQPARDDRDRRVYREEDVEVCLDLAKLGIAARRRSQKLSLLVAAAPKQLQLLDEKKLAS
jgi:DNA-binding transcriptional MerR regulator